MVISAIWKSVWSLNWLIMAMIQLFNGWSMVKRWSVFSQDQYWFLWRDLQEHHGSIFCHGNLLLVVKTSCGLNHQWVQCMSFHISNLYTHVIYDLPNKCIHALHALRKRQHAMKWCMLSTTGRSPILGSGLQCLARAARSDSREPGVPWNIEHHGQKRWFSWWFYNGWWYFLT